MRTKGPVQILLHDASFFLTKLFKPRQKYNPLAFVHSALLLVSIKSINIAQEEGFIFSSLCVNDKIFSFLF